jgi:hypothetical protein
MSAEKIENEDGKGIMLRWLLVQSASARACAHDPSRALPRIVPTSSRAQISYHPAGCWWCRWQRRGGHCIHERWGELHH